MNTPIYDFARRYADSDAVRMHMPGHKGKPLLGCEALDLTEITGADELFAPDGIIAESEANASECFGCQTLYSAEGSSLCIRAMLLLAMRFAARTGRKPVIAAGRNVHKTFLTTAALLHFDIRWIAQPDEASYLSGTVTAAALETLLHTEHQPVAVWLTSPDYLGNLADIRAAAAFCHAHDMLLLVDGAHGAYLRFLPQSLHPADLGADLCCTSAHKTLPVLTGGAYLHIGHTAPDICRDEARQALAMFASTSPSYLILESLDLCNHALQYSFPAQLQSCLQLVNVLRDRLTAHGWTLCGDEPMKLTIRPKPFGYTGTELAEILQNRLIYLEFFDPDYVVMMPSPYHSADELQRVGDALCSIPRREPISSCPPVFPQQHVQIMTPADILTAKTQRLPVEECEGRICAEFSVSCPPAVPIVICGERITAEAIRCMQYYGVASCNVIQ